MSGRSSVAMSFDDSALQAKLDALKARLQATARPAAQAGAQVFYDEVRLQAPVGTARHGYKGHKDEYAPGNLRDAIYQVYSRDRSTDTQATFQVSYNQKKAFYGRFVEFGTRKMPARPFIRPAYDSRKAVALQQSKQKFIELAQEAIDGN